MARKIIDGTQSRGAFVRNCDVSASGAPINNKRTVRPKQAMFTGSHSRADKATVALIETPAPVHEPEISKQNKAASTAKAKVAKPEVAKSNVKAKKAARPKSNTAKTNMARPNTAKSKISGKVATRTAPKSATKSASVSAAKKGVSSKLNIAVADTKNVLPPVNFVSAVSNARAESEQSNPPWTVAEQSEDTQLQPLPRHAALQIYEKANWLSSIGSWMRNNVRPLFARRQKIVSVTRPAPQKLRPRDMIAELNRLSEENRALRRKLAQMRGDKK